MERFRSTGVDRQQGHGEEWSSSGEQKEWIDSKDVEKNGVGQWLQQLTGDGDLL